MRLAGVWVFAVVVWASGAWGQDAPGSMGAGPMKHPKPAVKAEDAVPEPPPVVATAVSNYDKAMFLKPFAPAEMAFLKQYDGAQSGELWHDKQFHKLMSRVMPDCMFHYGRDMGLESAMNLEMENSRTPVRVRDGRFVLVAGTMDHMLGGRAFVWFDMQDGIGLGGFYFQPTNGEPSPALNVFSRQVKEDWLGLSELPPDFDGDMIQWATMTGVPPVTARYFLTGENRKILLEHDEDYCISQDGFKMGPESGCEQMQADAADLDLSGAYYVEATRHATNATAWMLSQDQVAFIEVRNRRCGGVEDPLGCRIRLTREQIHTVIKHNPVVRPVKR